jgi:hypothetical protein
MNDTPNGPGCIPVLALNPVAVLNRIPAQENERSLTKRTVFGHWADIAGRGRPAYKV